MGPVAPGAPRVLVDELAAPFPVLADAYSVLTRGFGAASLPYVVLIDGAGRLRWQYTGADPDLGALTKAIDELLDSATEP